MVKEQSTVGMHTCTTPAFLHRMSWAWVCNRRQLLWPVGNASIRYITLHLQLPYEHNSTTTDMTLSYLQLTQTHFSEPQRRKCLRFSHQRPVQAIFQNRNPLVFPTARRIHGMNTRLATTRQRLRREDTRCEPGLRIRPRFSDAKSYNMDSREKHA